MRIRPVMATLVVAGVLVAGCSEGNVYSLEAGTCFDDPDGDEELVSDVPIVECAQEHDNEVFATFDLPDGDYPGEMDTGNLADDGCLERFEAYVGTDYDASRFISSPLFPLADGWDAGDREVVCVLYDSDEARLTGSAAGTAE